MKINLLILTLLALLSSCYKGNETDVNKTCTKGCTVFKTLVTTGNNSSTPVSNAYVDLVWAAVEPFYLGDPNKLIAKGYTDTNGKITFSFTTLSEFKSGRFTITAKATPDFFSAYKSYYDIQLPDSINAHIHLPSIAHLRLVYKNFYPTSENDLFAGNPYFNNYESEPIILSVSSQNPEYLNTFFYGNQLPFDSIAFTGNTAGDQFTYFRITKKRNGTREDLLDSIFIPKGSTKTYRLDFQK